MADPAFQPNRGLCSFSHKKKALFSALFVGVFFVVHQWPIRCRSMVPVLQGPGFIPFRALPGRGGRKHLESQQAILCDADTQYNVRMAIQLVQRHLDAKLLVRARSRRLKPNQMGPLNNVASM